MRAGLTIALLLLLATPAAAIPRSGADTPRGVLFTQARLLRLSHFRAMYETTYTPNFRRRCPWRAFLREQSYGRQLLGARFRLRAVRVRMLSARRALIAYQFVSERGQIYAVTFRNRDLYAKIGNAWYDEYDRTSC